MSSAGAKARAVAAEIVDAVASSGQSLDAAISAQERRVPAGDRALLRMLSYGTLRYHWQLQRWSGQLLERPLQQKDSVIGALLSIGLYQLKEMRIPDHAVVSQTVEAARYLRRPKLAGLVNACLRRFQRDALATSSADDQEAYWNHPQWLIDTLKSDWPEDWQAILAANDERAPMWLRVNSLREETASYQQRLCGAGIAFETLAAVPDAICLAEPRLVSELPGFDSGDVSVQDAAAQIAARWLLAKTDGRILDACAAPGGKSGHLLELGGDAVTLVAIDSDAARSTKIHDNLERLGQRATIISADASKPEQWWDGDPFAGILLDAPCSATGVIRRHPDIKLLRRASDIEVLCRLQGALLQALWALLAPGGYLLYATCSTLSAENDAVVGRFLDSHDDALEDDVLPNYNIHDLMRQRPHGYQVLPGTAQLDGFYYACLQKKVC